MILRVLDQHGNVVHDCLETGCETSWDGYLIKTGVPAEGRADPDPAVWVKVDRQTVRQRPPA